MLCTKRSFINRHEAKAMLRSTQQSPSDARKEQRTYKCDKCRTYHLTSMPLEEYLAQKAADTLRLLDEREQYLESLN